MSPNEVVSLVGGIVAIMGVLLAVVGWYIRITVERVVRDATINIRPGHHNGGKSLADIADKIDRITSRLDDMEARK